MMSWLRTGVSLIGFGFAIVQFFERLGQMPGAQPALHPAAPMYLGLALIAAGVLSVLISIFQYWRIGRYLRAGPFAQIAGLGADAMHSPVLAVAVLLVLIGVFAFCAVLLRFV